MYAHKRIQEDYQAREEFLRESNHTNLIARLIDQTLLKADASHADFRNLCEQANQFRFRTVCIPSSQLESAALVLEHDGSKNFQSVMCTVIGFPLGNSSTDCKVAEINASQRHGATEFDYVQNIAWVRDKNWQKLTAEAQELVNAAQGDVVKVILETSLLSEDEILQSALAAARGGVHVLKTSTGFGQRGASIQDLTLLRDVVERVAKENGTTLGIKASGGIKTFRDALEFLRAGATRLGTSSGVSIVTGPSSASSSATSSSY